MRGFYNENGITIVSLVITIIILLIIASVGVNIGINGIDSSKDSKLRSELDIVEHAVLEQYAKYKTTKNSVYLVGNKITRNEAENFANEMNVTLGDSNGDYYKLDTDALESIGINNTTDEYVVNYFTGEVMNITVKTINGGIPLYTKAN